MRLAVVVRGQHGDRRTRLGQAVGVDEADVRQQLQSLAHQRQRHLRAAVGQVAQRRQAMLSALQHGDDAVQHGRHHGRAGDVLGVDQTHPFLGVEDGQIDHLAAGVQVRQRRADSCDVVRRHADQRRIGRLGRPEFDGASDVAGQVVVGELDGLGLRRGARREQHDADRVRVGELRGRFGIAGLSQKVVGHDDLLGNTGQAVRPTQLVEVTAVDDHQWVGQPGDQPLDAVGGQPVVDRRERHPGARRGEDQQRQHRAAEADVGNMGRLGARDEAGAAVGEIAELLSRQPRVSRNHSGPVGIARCRHLEK